MKFDRKKFFDAYRQQFGPLSQQQVSGLNFILDSVEVDPYVTDIRWLAYMLATTKHETADTFQPIHEYGSHAYFVKRYGGQTALGKRLGNDTPEEGAIYAGEGDVQITGETNYEKAEDALRREYPELIAAFEARTGKTFDLTVGDQPNDEDDAKNAGDPAIAYAIMSHGMRTGMFTGRKLSDFLNDKRTDYKNSRRIINAMDQAEKIAGYAREFEQILTSAELAEDPANVATSDTQKGERNDDLALTPDQSQPAQPTADPGAPTAVTTTEQTENVTTEVTTIPGHGPDVEPTQVSQNGPQARSQVVGGIAATVGSAVLAWATGHLDAVGIIAICVTVLILSLVFRGVIMDAIRMFLAADPTKYNVK